MASLSLSGCFVRSQAVPGFRRPKLITSSLSPTCLGFRLSSLIFWRRSNLHEGEYMIGLSSHLQPMTRLPVCSTSRPLSKPPEKIHLHFPSGFFKSYVPVQKRPIKFLTLASNNDNNSNGLRKDPNGRQENGKKSGGLGSEDIDGLGKENGQSIFNSIRWGELFLNPDPDNILAVGLTGLLTWASVQVLWQLLFISLAILVAAIKIKGALRRQTGQRFFVAHAANSKPSGGDSVEEKSVGNTKRDASAQGPPLLTIVAGFFVFFLLVWIVGSLIMWLVNLIVNLASPK